MTNCTHVYSNVEKLLLLAMSKDKSRRVLNHVWCDGEYLVTTNGRMLCVADNTFNLESGFYDIVKNRKECMYVKLDDIGTYPNYKQVIPKYDTICGHWKFNKDYGSWCSEIYRDMVRKQSYLNMEYLMELRKIGEDFDASCEGRLSSWILTGIVKSSDFNCNVKLVIAPYKVEGF